MQHTFVIPNDDDIDVLDNNQKNILCTAISEYTTNYMTERRIDKEHRDNIENDVYRSIKFNFLNSKTLYDDILNGLLSIDKLPYYEPYKLDIKYWSSLIDKRNKDREIKENMATVKIYKCRKCNNASCTTYQLQTRSIDEPMTTYVCCKVCGNQWKISS